MGSVVCLAEKKAHFHGRGPTGSPRAYNIFAVSELCYPRVVLTGLYMLGFSSGVLYNQKKTLPSAALTEGETQSERERRSFEDGYFQGKPANLSLRSTENLYFYSLSLVFTLCLHFGFWENQRNETENLFA